MVVNDSSQKRGEIHKSELDPRKKVNSQRNEQFRRKGEGGEFWKKRLSFWEPTFCISRLEISTIKKTSVKYWRCRKISAKSRRKRIVKETFEFLRTRILHLASGRSTFRNIHKISMVQKDWFEKQNLGNDIWKKSHIRYLISTSDQRS